MIDAMFVSDPISPGPFGIRRPSTTIHKSRLGNTYFIRYPADIL